MNKQTFNNLIKIADNLDKNHLHRYADLIDQVIKSAFQKANIPMVDFEFPDDDFSAVLAKQIMDHVFDDESNLSKQDYFNLLYKTEDLTRELLHKVHDLKNE